MADIFKNVPEIMESIVQAALDKVSLESVEDGISFKTTFNDEETPNPAVFVSVDRAQFKPEYLSDRSNYALKQCTQMSLFMLIFPSRTMTRKKNPF